METMEEHTWTEENQGERCGNKTRKKCVLKRGQGDSERVIHMFTHTHTPTHAHTHLALFVIKKKEMMIA